jgi:DNA invertase Pin-like site-specific DNA recombinase
MRYNEITKLKYDQVVMYLRKSRSDDPDHTVEEVLEKHEIQLQEYAERELGGRIHEENIYREVVSGGESIAEREAIQSVLARCEDPTVKAVLVIEPQRLSRGSLTDCDKLMKTFELSSTFVITPMMTYDLSRKMERKFFQDELMRGRDYLEYTKEILFRGRVAAAKRGVYNGQFAPYGYKKVLRGKDHTLEIIEDEAEVVRMIFKWYTEDQLSPGVIASRLNEMGIKAPKTDKWVRDTIRKIVRNEHYTGHVVFNKFKDTQVLENGEIVVKRLLQKPEDIIIAEGKHDAIISMETWELAAERVASNPRTKFEFEVQNQYSGILRCSKCGRVMVRRPYKNYSPRYECRESPRCYKSIKTEVLDAAILDALENSELPTLQLKVKNKEGDSLKIQQNQLKKLEKQMEEYRDQEDKQYELLETGKYTQDLFDRRNAALRQKMEDCQSQIYKVKSTMPKSVDYAERVTTLQHAIAMLKDPDATPEEKNKVLKTIVARIDYTSVTCAPENRWKKGPRGEVSPFTIAIHMKL